MTEPAPDVVIDAALVRELLLDQHPHLADHDVELVGEGWDHVMARLRAPDRADGGGAGGDLCLRLPRRALAADRILDEQRVLRTLGPRLPIAIPAVLGIGRATSTYPYSWTVLGWLDGEPATTAPPMDQLAAATALGGVLAALHQPAPADAPTNPYRGVPLADRVDLDGDGSRTDLAGRLDALVRAGFLDPDAAAHLHAVVDDALEVPSHPGPPTWVHGDLHPRNVLVDGGRISAVIDWTDACAGDPAVDAIIAWLLLDQGVHDRFRAAARLDDATWRRGRGWAVHLGSIIAGSSDEAFAACGRRALAALARS